MASPESTEKKELLGSVDILTSLNKKNSASAPKKILSPTPDAFTYSSAFFATYLGSLSYF